MNSQTVQFRLWPAGVKTEIGLFRPDSAWQGEVVETPEEDHHAEDGSEDDVAIDEPTPPAVAQ